MTDLRTARAHSIPLSVLRGFTFPTDRWGEKDGMLAAALTMYEAGLCPGCGQPLVESTDPANDPDAREATHRYEALDPVRCFACTAVEAKAKHYDKSTAPRALRFASIRRPRPHRVAGR